MSSSATFADRRGGGGAILGVWDGHDAGAAVVVDGALVAAVNEERLTRRKLEIRFPSSSIALCLNLAGITAADVTEVAVSTSDLAKTLTRWMPSAKEEYYRVRRRLREPGPLSSLTRAAKYALTPFGSSPITRWLSGIAVARELRAAGIATANVRFYDHHLCHAAGAALTCGMDACAVLTI